MKNKLPLIVALTSALGLPFASAQDERPPQPPQPDGQRPAGPPDGQRRERRPDGERGPGTPDGERGPARRPDGDRSFSLRGEAAAAAGAAAAAAGGAAHAHAGGMAETAPAHPQKPTPFIGVMTAPVPPSLGAQIGLAEGFGLVVEEVVPDSPAAAAGLQRYDVLKLLNDQQLTDPNQLATLVRSVGKDKEVTLTILRKGQEQKLTLKIGERMLPEKAASGPFGDFNWRMEPLRRIPEAARDATRRGEDAAGRVEAQMRVFQQRLGEFKKRMEEWQKNPTGNPPEIPKLEMPKPPEPPAAPQPPAPRDLLREVRPGGAPQVRVDQDGAVTTWNTAQARVVVKDDNGEIEVRTEDGHRTVAAKNPAGEIIFNGPVDTEEQRRALPEPVGKALEKIRVQSTVKSGAAASAQTGPRSAPAQPRGERAVQ